MRMFKKIAALAVAPSLILTGYTLGRVSDNVPTETVHMRAYNCGNEDSKNWHAALCGNRTMGVKIDVTPNNPRNGVRWVNLKFSTDGKSGTFKPRGF